MKGVRELNLELGYPTVDEALRRLEAELSAVRKMKMPVIKIIHGYGSSGKGGRIRTATRKCLAEQQAAGKISAVIRGEVFSIFSEDTRRAFARCENLRQDGDLDNENRGITFVIL